MPGGLQLGLARRKQHYAEHGKTLPYAAQNLELTALKNRPGLGWLKEADGQALQESLRDLDRAFANFFEKRAQWKETTTGRCGLALG